MKLYHPFQVDWLKARNQCREYCMDLVSIESPTENDKIENFIKDRKRNFFKNVNLRVRSTYFLSPQRTSHTSGRAAASATSR